MKSNEKLIVGLLSFILVVFFVFSSMTFVSYNVLGLNTTITRVNITNVAPNIFNVFIVGAPIDLTVGNTTSVNCTGYVYDADGWADVTSANATIYDTTLGYGDTYDNNFRYVNKTCNCTQQTGEANNASCSCLFNVEYYANNGTWRCNMTVSDDQNISDYLESGSATFNTVIGIGIPLELDFGNLSVLETSLDRPLNISNFGNRPINISVRGFGGITDASNPGNTSMWCETNNITIGDTKFSRANGSGYSVMAALTNDSRTMNLTIDRRTDDSAYGNDTNTTYWKILIPIQVGGSCNGTLVFQAIEAEI